MAIQSLCENSSSGTLAAGVATVLLIETAGARTIEFVLANTGTTNAIDTVKVEKAPLGANYGTLTAVDTAIGTVAHSTSSLVTLTENRCRYLKITLTSASGTTYALDLIGG